MTLFTKTLFRHTPGSASKLLQTGKTGLYKRLRDRFLFIMIIWTCTSMGYVAGNIVPATPGTINGLSNVCALVGTSQTTEYNISPVVGAELYLWTLPPTMELVSGQGSTRITVRFSTGFTAAANKQLKVRAISEEGNSPDRVMYLAAQHPSTPRSINGPTSACAVIGTPNRATYSIARDLNASAYIWAAPAGTSIIHPNGSGIHDTIIQVLFKPGYKTGALSVQSVNSCGMSSARQLNVSGSAPAMPGMITGPTNVCAYMLPNGVAATYSISPVAGASSYTWLLPDDCIIDHPNGGGAGDVSINVQFSANFTGGAISVAANSGCDEGPARTLTLTKFNPSTPGIISSMQKEICPFREYSYTLPSMPANTNSINWEVPASAIGFSGQGTTSITVLYPESRITGNVSATGVNNCATSASRVIPINFGRCQLERGTNSAGRGVVSAAEKKMENNSKNKNLTSHATGITISPNPSKSAFKVQVGSGQTETIRMKLIDLQGRELKKLTVAPGQSILFGAELRAGTYILEITEGLNKRTEKLMKL